MTYRGEGALTGKTNQKKVKEKRSPGMCFLGRIPVKNSLLGTQAPGNGMDQKGSKKKTREYDFSLAQEHCHGG